MIATAPPDGLKALITGANKGIGKAIAGRLMASGASLLLVGRDLASLVETRNELQAASPGTVEILQLDITSADDLSPAIDAGIKAIGGLNALVNNAGANRPMRLFRDLDPEEFRRIVEVNFLAHVAVTRAVLPHLLRSHRAAIVNILSMAAKIGVPGWSAYCSAKHGMLGFTKALAREVAGTDIRVNAVCPGFVKTDMTSQDSMAEWADALGLKRRQLINEVVYKQAPLQKYVEPGSVAAAVAYLLSDEAADITGQSINVSAGIGDY